MGEKEESSPVEKLLDEYLQALAGGQDTKEVLKGVDKETADEVTALAETAQTVQRVGPVEASPAAKQRAKKRFLDGVKKKQANK